MKYCWAIGLGMIALIVGCTEHDSPSASNQDSGAAPADDAGTGGDLCDGLVQDKDPHPMTALAKPALGEAVIDAEFGTKLRRITAVSGTSENPAIRPLYATVPAWNADESRLLLLNIEGGSHELYDGRSYKFIRKLGEINPPDVEQVYWHATDPDILLYVEGKSLIRYHVGAATKEEVHTFEFCNGNATSGSDPMFISFDTNRIGLRCDDQLFIYDIALDTVIARKTMDENPPQIAPSGALAWLSDSGRVTDDKLNVLRMLDIKEPFGHSSMGRSPSGADTWNGQVFDEGPRGNSDIGTLVTWDMTRATSKVIIGPKTGYPYPPDGHISAMAFKQPGWVFVSTFGNTSGAGLLDMEMLVADTVSGKVCRVGRHRSWGKANTHLAEPYWSEPHTVPSPSGTRAAFASDWENGTTVDTYVLELPSYKP